MSTKTVSSQNVSKILGKWYNALIRHELDEAVQLKAEVENVIEDTEQDRTLLLYYSLLNFRHNLLTKKNADSHNYAKSIKPFEEKVGPLLTHYYYFFTGMYHAYEGQYAEALHSYITAEEYLTQIPDDIEKGEFHYRVASVYYHIRQPMLAFKHAQQAKTIFDANELYLKNSAGCENILSLCYLANKDFVLAEKQLNSALNTVKALEDSELELYMYYNFGFLFAEKEEPHQAIYYLNKVDAAGLDPIRTPFLLAREYFKVGSQEEAFRKIDFGLKACGEIKNTEYAYHYAILKAFHDGSDDRDIESIVNEGVAFFDQHRLHGFDYVSQLAEYFFEKDNYEKASLYYKKADGIRKNSRIFGEL